MSDLMLDVGQANEFKLACRREGLDNEDIKFLCDQKGLLANVRNFRRGLVEFKSVEHAIDLGAEPLLPNSDWKVEEHQKGKVAKLERRGDDLFLDGKKIEFWLSKKQRNGSIVGNDLRKEVSKQPVLNANVLDYLREHPQLIPDSWKKDENDNTRYIFFWGTVYRDPGGCLCVGCLCWDDSAWDWRCSWLGSDWFSNDPAAVSAS